MVGHLRKRTRGAALIEYGILVGFVAMAAIGSVDRIRSALGGYFDAATAALDSGSLAGGGGPDDADAPGGGNPEDADGNQGEGSGSGGDGGSAQDPGAGDDEDGDDEDGDDEDGDGPGETGEPDEPGPEERACFGGSSDRQPATYVGNDIVIVKLAGTQIGSFESVWGNGNNRNRTVYVNGVAPLGGASEIFTLQVRQIHGRTQAHNGQFARIIAPDGTILDDDMNLQPNRQQHLAGGDEHMIITRGSFLIDLDGLASGVVTYGYEDEVGDPSIGDNDGEFDWQDTGCSPT